MHAAVLALLWALSGATLLAGALDEFISESKTRHGEAGERAARFLVEHMPEADKESLSSSFLTENLDLAFRARKEFPWAATVPDDLFLNDVLPYAVFDETRDSWRAELLSLSREIVKGATTATKAAQALNQKLFNQIQVHYNTGRKRPNQSLKESRELGKATCTGLSIILVEACRSVGIPARAVGTPLWANERGNHTWVEVWDGSWHFTGADEFDANGLNRGWFVGDASQAKADDPRHAIYATSWKRDGTTFPMVWSRQRDTVAAVNVTPRYAKAPEAADLARLGVRLWDRKGGTRLIGKVCVLDGVRKECALAETKSGTADLNDMPRFNLKPGTRGWLRFTRGNEVREMPFGPLDKGDPTVDALWPDLTPASATVDALQAWVAKAKTDRPSDEPALKAPLSRTEADRLVELLGADRLAEIARDRNGEMESRSIQIGDRTLRWLDKSFGDAASGQRSLWISMHGGGGAPPQVNDQQWQNQIRLYEPKEGIYVAPRAPTDTWNLWHEAHIDDLFQRLIEDHVALKGVDPNRVYIMGYSAGGDGVWQLAPRMADRWAAAAMMAGHPNEASLLGLRNLPFALFMGADDGAYNRNRLATEKAAELDRLASADAGGYPHFVRIYEGLGHWMKRRDAEGVPWMAEFRRNPWPKKVVWQQDDVVHRRFYWLQIPDGSPIPERQKITASVGGQTIQIDAEGAPKLVLRLSDALVDLDQPIVVKVGSEERFRGKVPRQAQAILTSLAQRADSPAAATALLEVP